MHSPPAHDHTLTAHRRPPRRPGILAVDVVVLTGCAAEPPATALVVVDDQVHLTVELARTTNQQRLGLAGRDRMPQGTGMLFEFDPPGARRVWMAGMTFPIDIAWISNGRVIATDTLPPCTAPHTGECPRWQSPGDVEALLETSAGSLDDIDPGATITLDTARSPATRRQ